MKLRLNLLLLGIALSLGATVALAQSPSPPQDRPGPNPTGADAKLTPRQFQGQGIFLQRCSLCHLARSLKFGAPATVGPNLKTAFKEVSQDQEKDLRTFILNGSPHMPGFRYSLSPKEIDNLVAYMKVM